MHVIIVGAGLSGICLAHSLEKNKIPFKLFDTGVNHSTKAAAGMINPMTFRRMIKTWKGDDLIPFIKKFYPEIEKKVEGKFFFPIRLRRVHSSTDEVQMWADRMKDKSYTQYINPTEPEEMAPQYIKNSLGSAFVNVPGYIDSSRFLKLNHAYFLKLKKLEYHTFDFEKLDTTQCKYRGESYTHLIFAEGFQGEDNPFFSYLPFKNAKGEVLTIESDTLKTDEILNRKCFVLPTEDGDFKLGSTYTWGTKDPSPTEEAKEELLENYNALSSASIQVVSHEAGIRPASADRRPMIGEHPKHKHLYIFNGLGAKGFLIAPYFAVQFVEFLLGKEELDEEVNIQRFYNKYYKDVFAKEG